MDVEAEVTFMVKDDQVDALMSKAREIDEVNQSPEDMPETYRVDQALQIVWHEEPEWLHKNVLEGWTLDKAMVDGSMRMVWH
jgi:hypothetical protein